MKPLLKLLAENRGRGQFRAEASQEEATIYLYDTIVSDAETAAWWGGVDPLTFAKALVGIDAPVIHLRINSPGGDVFAAQAMAQALREHPARVIAHIDGYAASAATEVAVAADDVIMAPGAMYMIHNAWTIAMGNKNDLIDVAALLEKVDCILAEAYAAKSGADLQQVKDWMDAETWFTAQEAVAAGFADSVADKPKANAITDWNLSAYAHAPKARTANMGVQQRNLAVRQVPKNQMQPRFEIGDQVKIINPHAEGHEMAEIVLVSAEPVYGVQVYGMEDMGMHRWYTDFELELVAEAQDESSDASGAENKKKKPMKMQNDTDHLRRRLALVTASA